MGYTYEEYLRQLMKRAKENQAEYETSRRQQTEANAAEVDRYYADVKQQSSRQYKEKARQEAASYRSLFDANAVDELVARREAAEAIANTNMANSGLNNTQQTAISLQRSRADAATRAKRDQAVRSVMLELDRLSAEYDSEAATKKAKLYAQAEEDIRSNLQKLTDKATDRAQKLYDAQVEREYEAQQQEKRQAYEAAESEKERRHELYMLQQKEGIQKTDVKETDTKETDAEVTPTDSQSKFDPLIHGSRFAEKGGQSYLAVYVDAHNIKKREGNNAAWHYLKQRVNRQYIASYEMSDIMNKLGIVVPVAPSEEEINKKVLDYMILGQSRKAVEYVKSLHDSYLIDVKLAYKFYDKIRMYPKNLQE